MFKLIRWFARIVEDGTSGNPSVKRICLVVSVVTLAICTLILSVAAYQGHSVAAELAVVATPLASLGGYSYVRGKAVERTSAEQMSASVTTNVQPNS